MSRKLLTQNKETKQIQVIENVEFGKEILKSNSKADLKKAKTALEIAKENDKSKINHVWLTNGKTSRLVHPKRIASLLLDGWKQLNNRITKNKK